ncbi:Rz1-like lysis system protein LysC [Paracoccus sulfuroxidans]|uniref:Lipoprotein n=1 Tax=Paracoccus sulfuroxidans TaxID=384678 RepID=A0A562P1V9_9RHOB|nr:hypothetical protein [Paracoccus sulfuroxidans]TWI38220.1 hypothetical protein IQ24_00358 [Paracoccus sulfuroxidans]
MRLEHVLKLIALMMIILAFSGCSRDPNVVPIRIPENLLTCKDSPKKPDGDYTQKDVGVYIVDLHEAHADCKTRLKAVGDAVNRVD